MLNWTNRFNIFCFLDSQGYSNGDPAFECMLAAGSKKTLSCEPGDAFDRLTKFHTEEKDWLFGHLGYDLKNETESLRSDNPDHLGFPALHFFVPVHILQLNRSGLTIISEDDPEMIFSEINAFNTGHSAALYEKPKIKQRIPRVDYISIIRQLKEHILRGDCYEINFCQEFFAEDARIDPWHLWNELSAVSPNPFAVFYRINERYCLSASPERFLKRSGTTVIAQPIKGTARRDHTDPEKDEQLKQTLLTDLKERSENVMIVDLVRNDLSRICREGSVHVKELFGIYSFPQVHQMISTVAGSVEPGTDPVSILRSSFPMGSMTGAPKKRVMELIEQYERSKRGLFSGAIGYITPEGDFDFNVIIRSLLYNSTAKYLSFQAGSAITFNSDPEKEYEECLLKAEAMIKAIN